MTLSVIIVVTRGFEKEVANALIDYGLRDVVVLSNQMEACEGEATCGWLLLQCATFQFDEALFHACGALFVLAALVRTRIDCERENLSDTIAKLVQDSNEWPDVLRAHSEPQGPFRVSGVRSGNHPFGTTEMLRIVAGAVIDRTGWDVNLDNPELEVFVMLSSTHCLVGIPWGIQRPEACMARRKAVVSLPQEKRDYLLGIDMHSLRGLRVSVCNGLLRLVGVQPGQVVVDSFAGSGNIPIECAVRFPGVQVVCCDADPECVIAAGERIAFAQAHFAPGSVCSCLVADAQQLPFPTASVDHFVSDLPFGITMHRCPASPHEGRPHDVASTAQICITIPHDKQSRDSGNHTKASTSDDRSSNVGGLLPGALWEVWDHTVWIFAPLECCRCPVGGSLPAAWGAIFLAADPLSCPPSAVPCAECGCADPCPGRKSRCCGGRMALYSLDPPENSARSSTGRHAPACRRGCGPWGPHDCGRQRGAPLRWAADVVPLPSHIPIGRPQSCDTKTRVCKRRCDVLARHCGARHVTSCTPCWQCLNTLYHHSPP